MAGSNSRGDLDLEQVIEQAGENEKLRSDLRAVQGQLDEMVKQKQQAEQTCESQKLQIADLIANTR